MLNGRNFAQHAKREKIVFAQHAKREKVIFAQHAKREKVVFAHAMGLSERGQ